MSHAKATSTEGFNLLNKSRLLNAKNEIPEVIIIRKIVKYMF